MIMNKLEIFLKKKNPFFDLPDHRTNVKRLCKIFNVETIDEIADCLVEPDNVMAMMLEKYAVKTCIEIIDTIKHFLTYYDNTSLTCWEFDNVLDNLIDLHRNPKHFQKLTFIDIKDKLLYFQIKFLAGEPCYTHYRNFLLFNLFFLEAPMALHHYSNINIVNKDFVDIEQLIYRRIYLVKKKHDYCFVLNRWCNQKFEGQFIYTIDNDNIKKLLGKFFSHYSKNINYFLTTRSGKPMSNGNIANTVVNFSRSFFGKSTTLNNIRKVWWKYKDEVYDPDIEKKLILYKFK